MTERIRWQLEGAIQVVVAGLVVWVALAAGNVYPWNLPVGRIARWAVLGELCALALAYAVLRRRIPRPDAFALVVAALPALALLSALWSSDPSLTLKRAATLTALFAAGAALAYGTAGRSEAVGVILLGLLAGAVLIALGGLVNLAVASDRALVPATTGQGARYNGLGGNPNTVAMLLALSLPLALWALLKARSRAGRIAAGAALVLFQGSIAASGSRGALVAGLAALLVFALVLPQTGRLRTGLAAGALVLFAVSVAAGQVPPRAERDPTLNPEFGSRVSLGPRDAQFILPLENEIGYVRPSGGPSPPRGLLDSSGRVEAWVGGLELAAERPLLGHGFGTEEIVFVDRYYRLLSSRVENAYVATALQLGVAGIVLVCGLLAYVAVRAGRAVSRLDGPQRRVAAACAGVFAGGVTLGVTQSFLTSVGSPATAPFWLCVFLLAALTGPGLRDRAPLSAPPRAARGRRARAGARARA